MKELKKLAVITALLGATCGTKAFEKDFEPVKEGASEAQGIEVVGGQLMVKSNGRMNGVDVPYTFVSTNTTHFANSGYALKEMADANSVALDGSDVYFTRSSDTEHVYRFSVSNKSALNGLDGKLERIDSNEPISGILAVEEGKIYGQSVEKDNVVELGETTASSSDVVVPENLVNTIHSVYKDKDSGEYRIRVLKGNSVYLYDEYENQIGNVDVLGIDVEKHPVKSIVSMEKEHYYILTTDGHLYNEISWPLNGYAATVVSGIKASNDGKSLLITYKDNSGKTKVNAFDVASGKSSSVYDETAADKKFFANKELKANGLKYYVTQKRIGYSLAD